MGVRVRIVLIALPFIANLLTSTFSASSRNSTTEKADQTTKVYTGILGGKFDGWRARCREKIEFLRIVYNIYRMAILGRLRSTYPILSETDVSLLSDTLGRMVKIENYQEVRKSPLRNQTFLGKMYNFCLRPISNVSNLLAEIKKHTTYEPQRTTRQSRLKIVLDEYKPSGLNVTAGMPDTTPNPENAGKIKWTKSNLLRFASGRNAKGQPETVEFYMDLVHAVNRSTLMNWLPQVEDVKLTLENMKDFGDFQVLRQIFGMDCKDKINPLEMVEFALEFVDEFERRIHEELRKPEEDVRELSSERGLNSLSV